MEVLELKNTATKTTTVKPTSREMLASRIEGTQRTGRQDAVTLRFEQWREENGLEKKGTELQGYGVL